MELYFVTSNENKIKEAQAILDIPISIIKLDLPEIQSLDPEEIINHKAKIAYEKIKKPLLVEDVSFLVDSWGGFPGPFIKYLQKAGGNELFLRMMSNEKNRKASAIATIGLHTGTDIILFSGRVDGQIVQSIRGVNGWGFDFIFQPDGEQRTFAQMSDEEKNKLSHRYRALAKLKAFLKK
jgi:XTP/dITP diphosphohydrolase